MEPIKSLHFIQVLVCIEERKKCTFHVYIVAPPFFLSLLFIFYVVKCANNPAHNHSGRKGKKERKKKLMHFQAKSNHKYRLFHSLIKTYFGRQFKTSPQCYPAYNVSSYVTNNNCSICCTNL